MLIGMGVLVLVHTFRCLNCHKSKHQYDDTTTRVRRWWQEEDEKQKQYNIKEKRRPESPEDRPTYRLTTLPIYKGLPKSCLFRSNYRQDPQKPHSNINIHSRRRWMWPNMHSASRLCAVATVCKIAFVYCRGRFCTSGRYTRLLACAPLTFLPNDRSCLSAVAVCILYIRYVQSASGLRAVYFWPKMSFASKGRGYFYLFLHGYLAAPWCS